MLGLHIFTAACALLVLNAGLLADAFARTYVGFHEWFQRDVLLTC